MGLYTGLLNIYVALVEADSGQDYYDDAQGVEVKGDTRDWRRPKSGHPFVIDNLHHLL
jgi:hypothetical protein